MANNNIIMTRTPLRVSLMGGGSDTKEFYRHNIGKVVSMTICL